MNTKYIKMHMFFPVDILLLLTGIITYIKTRKTPNYSYQSLIRMFCVTRGYSNDLFTFISGLWNKPYLLHKTSGLLGEYSQNSIDSIASNIRDKGYHVFEHKLPTELCDQLLEFALQTPSKPRDMDGSQIEKQPESELFQRSNPHVCRYDFDANTLINNQYIQKIMADMSILSVAQQYLGCIPKLDVVSMWWHTAFGNKPDGNAAQLYHFDMDRIKWLKFFIYLTDVTPKNGPHIFVAGSHRSGGIPASLLSKGYSRLSDQDIEQHYSKKEIIEYIAERGTIIAEDTRGLHKGKHVETGDRLILQLQFSNNLFGASYCKSKIVSPVSSELKETIKRYPRLYTNYT